MSPELQQKIFALKPEWFEGSCFNIECGDGWFDLIRDLIAKLIALESEEAESFVDFKVTQIKEKFGGLRCGVEQPGSSFDDDSWKRVFSIINSYEHRSLSVCEFCGKQARLRTLGYIQTLCRYPHDQTEG